MKRGEIRWFQGEMQQALDLAKAESKPVFVYWGAVWCPPCNVIKATVFPDEQVVSASAKYVSVYLDGDTQEAQSWGERLGASGYPTLMVLSPQGNEVARISSSVTAAEFAGTLERLASDLVPIEKIVERALKASDPAAIPREHWGLIAGYSWAQRAHLAKDPLKTSAVFSRLEERIPADMAVERSRIHFLYLERRIEEAGAAGAGKAEREREIAWVASVLKDTALARANLPGLAHGSKELVEWLFPEAGLRRSEFFAAYVAAMSRIRDSGGLSSYERLITDYPAVRFASLKGAMPLGEEMRGAIRDRVLAALRSASDDKEHSFVLNSGAYLLRKAGFAAEAYEILKSQVAKARSPYYVMSVIAELEEEDGNLEGALEWAGKAYRASLGAATRLQWGTNYLSTLIKARPEAKAEILAELEKFFEEHLVSVDAFLGRNKARMSRISSEAGQWGSARKADAELKKLAAKLRLRCTSDAVPESREFRASCRAYFGGFAKPVKS